MNRIEYPSISVDNNNNVYVNKNSNYSFTKIDYIANWITNNLHKRGIIELGANNYIILEEIPRPLHQWQTRGSNV